MRVSKPRVPVIQETWPFVQIILQIFAPTFYIHVNSREMALRNLEVPHDRWLEILTSKLVPESCPQDKKNPSMTFLRLWNAAFWRHCLNNVLELTFLIPRQASPLQATQILFSICHSRHSRVIVFRMHPHKSPFGEISLWYALHCTFLGEVSTFFFHFYFTPDIFKEC